MKKLGLLVFVMLFGIQAQAQKYFTRDGEIVFSSETPFEKFDGVSNTAVGVWDAESGAIQFSVLVNSFQFERALMQEHFNENYMESDQYPKAVMKGKIISDNIIDPSVDGVYEVTIKGKLTMHDETNDIEVPATLKINDGQVMGSSKFMINPQDYGIKIPKVVRDNIAENLEVAVDVNMEPYEN